MSQKQVHEFLPTIAKMLVLIVGLSILFTQFPTPITAANGSPIGNEQAGLEPDSGSCVFPNCGKVFTAPFPETIVCIEATAVVRGAAQIPLTAGPPGDSITVISCGSQIRIGSQEYCCLPTYGANIISGCVRYRDGVRTTNLNLYGRSPAYDDDASVADKTVTYRLLQPEEVDVDIRAEAEVTCRGRLAGSQLPDGRGEPPLVTPDSTKCPDPSIADPCSLADTSWYMSFPTLSLGGRGLPIDVDLKYSTRNWYEAIASNNLGVWGWTHSYARSLRPQRECQSAGNTVSCVDYMRTFRDDGTSYRFRLDPLSGTYSAEFGNFTQLTQTASGHTITFRNGSQEQYATNGGLTAIIDRFGNQTTVDWNAASGTLTVRNEQTSQALLLEHTNTGDKWQLNSVRDHPSNSPNGSGLRSVTVNYNGDGFPSEIVDAAGRTHTFEYDEQERLASYYNPNNVPGTPNATPMVNTYSGFRVTRQTLPNGNTVDFQWRNVTTGYDLIVTYNKGTPDARYFYYLHNYITVNDQPVNTGHLKTIHKPNTASSSTKLTYDINGQVTSRVDAVGRRIDFTYSPQGDLLTEQYYIDDITTDTITYTYDQYGSRTSMTLPDGQRSEWAYGANGVLSQQKVVAINGNEQVTNYQTNAYGQVIAQQLPSGTWNRQQYDNRGNPTFTTYDANINGNSGRIALAAREASNWRSYLGFSIDRQGIRTNYSTNPNGWRMAEVSDVGYRNVRTEWTYDEMGNVLTLTEDAGGLNLVTAYTYEMVGIDGSYAPATMTDADGNVTSYAYNRNGELISIAEEGAVDEAGNQFTRVTSYQHTNEGWLDKVLLHDSRVYVDYDYNNMGDVTSQRDARGIRTFYDYDMKGRLATLRQGAAAVTGYGAVYANYTYSYNGNDQATRVDGPDGWYKTSAYDAFGRLIVEEDAEGRMTRFTYDNLNRLRQVHEGYDDSAENIKTTYAYDTLNRLTLMRVDPDGLNLQTRYQYDIGSGNRWHLQRITDPAGATTEFSYNSLGQRASSKDDVGQIWLYEYDNLVRLTQLRDPFGLADRDTVYSYDALGRQTGLTRNGQTESWAYNADDTLASRTDFAGGTTFYRYDTTGRLTTIDYPSVADGAYGTGAVEASDVTFAYDASDNVISVQDALGQTDYAYDAMDRLALRTRDARTISYQYSKNSWLTNMNYFGEGSVAYAYDASGRVNGLTPWGEDQSTFAYESNGRLAAHNRPNAINTSYSYDGAGRLNNIDSGALHQLDYTQYKASGAIEAINEAVNGTTYSSSYTYDVLNRMVSVSYPAVPGEDAYTDTFDYDAVGNRIGDNNGGVSTTQPIGEVGQIANLTHVAQTIIFGRTYSNPVVLALTPARNGGETAIVRITDVQDDRFTAYIDEAPDKNGPHITEQVSYLVIEAGQWQLPDGTRVEAGVQTTGRTVGVRVANQWQSIPLTEFSSAPVVFSQVQSENDAGFVKTRIRNVTASSFQTALEREENNAVAHGSEQIGWLAIDAASGEWGSLPFVAGVTADAVTQAVYSTDFGRNFSIAPNFFANMNSYDGADGAFIRYRNITPSSATIYVEEDTTRDGEVNHTTETVGFLAIAGSGNLVVQSTASATAAAETASSPTAVAVSTVEARIGTVMITIALIVMLLSAAIMLLLTGPSKRKQRWVWAAILTAAMLLAQSMLPAISYAASYSFDASDLRSDHSYDNNGNLLNDGTTVYRYDTANRLVHTQSSTATVDYRYDGRGQLVQVVENGVVADLVLDEAAAYPRIAAEISTNNTTLYAFGPAGLAAVRSSNNDIRYPLLDHQGTVRHLTDAAGTLTDSYIYDAWGKLRSQTGTAPLTLGFTGERMNADGTVYLRARHYAPQHGRFVQRDSIDPGFAGNGTQGHNRFSYVLNSPINYVDPSGHLPNRREIKQWVVNALSAAGLAASLIIPGGTPPQNAPTVNPPKAPSLLDLASEAADAKGADQKKNNKYKKLKGSTDTEPKPDPKRKKQKALPGTNPNNTPRLPPANGSGGAYSVDVDVLGGDPVPSRPPRGMPDITIDVKATRVPDAPKGRLRLPGLKRLGKALPIAGAILTIWQDPGNAATECRGFRITWGSLGEAAIGEIPFVGDIFGSSGLSDGTLPPHLR